MSIERSCARQGLMAAKTCGLLPQAIAAEVILGDSLEKG
jgi:hypothetical protein